MIAKPSAAAVFIRAASEPLPAAGPMTVELDIAKGLTVGLSMLMLAKSGRIPDRATALLYEEVGAQLVAAARVAAKQVR